MRKYPDFCFKIQRIDDGKFSSGGRPPRFTNNGKVWQTYGYLTSHLKMLGFDRMTKNYGDCRLVVFVEQTAGSAETVTLEEIFYDFERDEILKRLNGK